MPSYRAVSRSYPPIGGSLAGSGREPKERTSERASERGERARDPARKRRTHGHFPLRRRLRAVVRKTAPRAAISTKYRGRGGGEEGWRLRPSASCTPTAPRPPSRRSPPPCVQGVSAGDFYSCFFPLVLLSTFLDGEVEFRSCSPKKKGDEKVVPSRGASLAAWDRRSGVSRRVV